MKSLQLFKVCVLKDMVRNKQIIFLKPDETFNYTKTLTKTIKIVHICMCNYSNILIYIYV